MMAFDDADTVSRRAARVSDLLERADEPARALPFPADRITARMARRSAVRWRAAAVIALLLAGAAGVPPVRAWIVGTVQHAWASVTGHESPAAQPSAAPVAPAGNMGGVVFPAPDPLIIRLATLQAPGGSVIVEGTDAKTVSVSITGEANAAEMLVTPDGVRITNRRASTAGYLVRVPASVSRVIVKVADQPPRSFDAPEPGHRFTVDVGVRSGAPTTLNQ
jgi:hypothetical protein